MSPQVAVNIATHMLRVRKVRNVVCADEMRINKPFGFLQHVYGVTLQLFKSHGS